MRGRPRNFMLAAAVAGLMSGAGALFPGTQTNALLHARPMPSEPLERMRRRVARPWERSTRKGDPGLPKKHRRKRAPRSWRRVRAATLRARRR